MSTKADFLASLAKSTEAVKSWPSWRQTISAPRPSTPPATARNEQGKPRTPAVTRK